MPDLKKLISAAGRLVPLGIRQRVIGDGYWPSWTSTTIHSILNRLSAESIRWCRAAELLKVTE